MPIDLPVAAYDPIAEWYDGSVRKKSLVYAGDLIVSDLLDLLGDMSNFEGDMLCDLACGQGEMARQIATRGAKVVGVDLAQKLLDIAQRQEEIHPLGITYFHDDAQSLASLEDAVFKGVLCNMALMDIPDLNATFHQVQRILRPDGWFAFTITHPCFQRPPAKRYDDEGFWRSDNPDGVRGKVGAHHRTLSTYLNAIREAGMFVDRLREPPLPDRDIPIVLVALCRKMAG